MKFRMSLKVPTDFDNSYASSIVLHRFFRLDALVYTLMADPIELPSGQICDRKNILRHLLSDPTNPFTRQPLKEDELRPAGELKARIKSWIQEKQDSKKKGGNK